MKNAIIIHGMPSRQEYFDSMIASPSNTHWLPWVKRELEAKGIHVETPEMPEPYIPVYEKWQEVFEQLHIDAETILIGHSCGAGFLLRWMSEHTIKVEQVILVAPWIDIENEITNGFFNFEIDTNLVNKTVSGISIFYSTDDDDDILDSVVKIKSIQGIKIHEFSNKGHFVSGSGVSEFPELLEEIDK